MGIWTRIAMGAVVLSTGALVTGQARADSAYRLTDASFASYNAINEVFAGLPQLRSLQCANLGGGDKAWKAEEARLPQAIGDEPQVTAAINLLASQLGQSPALRGVIEHQGLDARGYASFGIHYLLAQNAVESFGLAAPACDSAHFGDAAGIANCRFVVLHRGEQHPAPTVISAASCPSTASLPPAM